jgi:hypothetical protein
MLSPISGSDRRDMKIHEAINKHHSSNSQHQKVSNSQHSCITRDIRDEQTWTIPLREVPEEKYKDAEELMSSAVTAMLLDEDPVAATSWELGIRDWPLRVQASVVGGYGLRYSYVMTGTEESEMVCEARFYKAGKGHATREIVEEYRRGRRKPRK